MALMVCEFVKKGNIPALTGWIGAQMQDISCPSENKGEGSGARYPEIANSNDIRVAKHVIILAEDAASPIPSHNDTYNLIISSDHA